MTIQNELQTFPSLEMWTEEVSEEDRKDKFCTCESTALFRNKPDQSIFLAARIAGLEVTFALVGKNNGQQFIVLLMSVTGIRFCM